MPIGMYISIITLNVNGLNVPTKRHGLAEWIEKQDSYICCLQETQSQRQAKPKNVQTTTQFHSSHTLVK